MYATLIKKTTLVISNISKRCCSMLQSKLFSSLPPNRLERDFTNVRCLNLKPIHLLFWLSCFTHESDFSVDNFCATLEAFLVRIFRRRLVKCSSRQCEDKVMNKIEKLKHIRARELQILEAFFLFFFCAKKETIKGLIRFFFCCWIM